jgi:hypothetical protein
VLVAGLVSVALPVPERASVLSGWIRAVLVMPSVKFTRMRRTMPHSRKVIRERLSW